MAGLGCAEQDGAGDEDDEQRSLGVGRHCHLRSKRRQLESIMAGPSCAEHDDAGAAGRWKKPRRLMFNAFASTAALRLLLTFADTSLLRLLLPSSRRPGGIPGGAATSTLQT